MSAWTQILERKKELDALIKAEGSDAIKGRFKEIFDEFPAIKKIGWTQYTPYFNDGDACEFSVHEINFKAEGVLSGYEDSDPDEDENYLELWPDTYCLYEWNGSGRKDRKWLYPFSEALYNLNIEIQQNYEVLLSAFGDHCQVIVSKDEVTVTEYSHD